MAESQTTDSTLGERANELYWQSEQTIDQIVEELGIGRSTLYSNVRPQPAGASCPECGERLVYTNRSNRSAGVGTCRVCGARAEVDAAAAQPADREVELDHPLGVGAPARVDAREALAAMGRASDPQDAESGWSRWRHDLAQVPPERAAMIGGAAALGVVVGAVAARALREMS